MANMKKAPAMFPDHVDRNEATALPWPRAARKLPNATTMSVGRGGKMFSTAASAASVV
jgi:hypothetical protein